VELFIGSPTSVLLLSPANSSLYSYSINGQLLAVLELQPSRLHPFISLTVFSDHSTGALLLTRDNHLLVVQLPFLKLLSTTSLKSSESLAKAFFDKNNSLLFLAYASGQLSVAMPN
jgi:hypothetical protein